MDLIDSLRIIQDARDNDRLVIFVGAGVSANSGIPTWGQLIERIAEVIDYEVKDRILTAQEYLRIPEYYYNQKEESGELGDYYSLIRSILQDKDATSNPIDDIIFKILPHHIITTNYDYLLEQANDVNKNLFQVVSEDKHLIEKSNNRYIIKMHGDFSDIENIVLKESDYINYEQNHPLISVFIKALLISHTFLFIGYSLNDSNLNLIMGWIDYFCKQYDVTERPQNFLLLSKGTNDYEKKRLEKKSIFVIAHEQLRTEVTVNIKIPDKLTHPDGRGLYAFLSLLVDSSLSEKIVPKERYINERYILFEDYNHISISDIIKCFKLYGVERLGTEIIAPEEIFNRIQEYINLKESPYKELLSRGGITALCHRNSNEQIEFSTEVYDDLFKEYLDNQYISIINEIPFMNTVSERIYYQRLLNPKEEEIRKWIKMDASVRRGYIGVILQKMRERLATITLFDSRKDISQEIRQIFMYMPTKYETSTKYLYHVFSSMSEEIMIMEDILAQQEKRYEYRSTTWFSNHAHYNIWKLQSYAYEYYFFIKMNYLPIDSFTEIKNYLSYYLKAILCSYSPIYDNPEHDGFLLSTHREPYSMGEIEVDMFTKYVDPKVFQSWLKKYYVQRIVLDENVDLLKKVEGLCEYFREYKYRSTISVIHNIFIMLIHVDRDDGYKIKCLLLLTDFIENLIEKIEVDEFFRILIQAYFGIKPFEDKSINSKLVDFFINENVLKVFPKDYSNRLDKLLKKLKKYVSEEHIKILLGRIEMKANPAKLDIAYTYRSWLPMEYNKSIWDKEVNISFERYETLLLEGIVKYSDAFLQKAIHILDQEVARRINNPGVRTYPDYLRTTIDTCLIIKLYGFPLDLKALEQYKDYSEHLQFLLSPEEYDYTKVDMNHYMWQNIIFSEEYREYFISNKNKLLTKDLKKIFDWGLASKSQQKIVYGLLLEDSELMGY